MPKSIIFLMQAIFSESKSKLVSYFLNWIFGAKNQIPSSAHSSEEWGCHLNLTNYFKQDWKYFSNLIPNFIPNSQFGQIFWFLRQKLQNCFSALRSGTCWNTRYVLQFEIFNLSFKTPCLLYDSYQWKRTLSGDHKWYVSSQAMSTICLVT